MPYPVKDHVIAADAWHAITRMMSAVRAEHERRRREAILVRLPVRGR